MLQNYQCLVFDSKVVFWRSSGREFLIVISFAGLGAFLQPGYPSNLSLRSALPKGFPFLSLSRFPMPIAHCLSIGSTKE
ncbi:hypothetical protein [uncultured Cyclobacterium sp.]|uniref:hypothetical protein n=1 Tax=uncultured Cyclobacterium sp. TaxID=453820 RepID=UPI0030EC8DC4